MSRYEINKLMRAVIMEPGLLREYTESPDAFMAEWPGALDADERAAFRRRNYGALYGMGAHPYLLWSFAEAVWVPGISRPELVERFREAAAAHGYPDFAT